MAGHHQARDQRRNGRRAAAVAGALAITLVLAACGSGTKTNNAASTTSTPGVTAPVDKTLGIGVTAKTVTIGVTLVDFDNPIIKDNAPAVRLGQEAIYGAFIKNVNDHGGIAGRKLVPVYKKYIPVGTSFILPVCTSLTEDSKVFATIGTYYEPSGAAQLCMAKDHQRVLLTFDLTQHIMDKAPPGLIVTPANTPERSVQVLLELLAKRHTLDGKTVAVLGETRDPSLVTDDIVPALKKLHVKMGDTALLTISGGDTIQPQSELDSFIEKWKSENVSVVVLDGKEASSEQFVSKLRKKMPNLLLLADDTEVLSYGQSEKHSGKSPNAYEGTLAVSGETHAEYAAGPNWKYCKDVYKAETGKTAPGPDDVIPFNGSKTQTLDTYGAINDACQLVTMFQDIGNKVGPYLNNTNWVNTVNHFGHIENRGSGPYSSLSTGKYDADDNYRLVEFDSSLPPDGNWKALTPLENVPK
jgi:hypothetical protein